MYGNHCDGENKTNTNTVTKPQYEVAPQNLTKIEQHQNQHIRTVCQKLTASPNMSNSA